MVALTPAVTQARPSVTKYLFERELDTQRSALPWHHHTHRLEGTNTDRPWHGTWDLAHHSAHLAHRQRSLQLYPPLQAEGSTSL